MSFNNSRYGNGKKKNNRIKGPLSFIAPVLFQVCHLSATNLPLNKLTLRILEKNKLRILEKNKKLLVINFIKKKTGKKHRVYETTTIVNFKNVRKGKLLFSTVQ